MSKEKKMKVSEAKENVIKRGRGEKKECWMKKELREEERTYWIQKEQCVERRKSMMKREEE